MSQEFIKKGNKYYRNNSDGSQSEVQLGEDGYFRWTQNDGKKVRSAKKYKVVTKPKEKSFIQKVGDWLVDASIGASVAENPSVMTAAGYEKENGKWQVNPTSKGATKLREDLPIIGMTGLAISTPGAVPTLLVGSGTEALERKALGKSVGDVTSNFVKENNPISSNGYLGTLGSYLWDKGSDLVRPEYSLYPIINWGTTPRLVGSGAEFDVYSAPFSRTVTKIGDITPSEAALKSSVPATIPLKYKGQTPEGLYKYTQRKAVIPKTIPKLRTRMKLYNKIMEGKKYYPGNYDGQTKMLDFISKDNAITDLGQGNIGYRNLFDYIFRRQPVIIDNAVLDIPDYLALYQKKGGRLIPKADSGIKTKEEIALERSRNNKKPNDNFINAWDLDILGHIKGLLGYGATCTNTATGFYYPNNTTAGSKNLLENPEQAGFKIIDQKDAVPGSIIVISNPDGTHRHSTIFDSVHKGEPYWYYDKNDRNQYYVQPGDTLVNYSNGKRGEKNYRKKVPLNRAFVNSTKHTYLISRKNGGLIPKFQNSGKFLENSLQYINETISPFIDNATDVIYRLGLDTHHKFTTKDFNEFVSVMYPIFYRALQRKGYSMNMLQNLIRQSAYESDYGVNPRGAQGYNLGGIKWVDDKNSKTYHYKHTINPEDGIEYVDFDNLWDYANYKIELLNDTYDALNAKDTNDFVKRLHGHNSSKKSYSKNPNGYMETLNTMKSLDKAYNNYVFNNSNKDVKIQILNNE